MNIELKHVDDNVILVNNETGQELPLSELVRISVEQYFTQLNGHPISKLHAMVICEVEKPLIQTVLTQTRNNQTKAAKMLGMSRSTLRKKISLYHLE